MYLVPCVMGISGYGHVEQQLRGCQGVAESDLPIHLDFAAADKNLGGERQDCWETFDYIAWLGRIYVHEK
jgi:hypothetical protein